MSADTTQPRQLMRLSSPQASRWVPQQAKQMAMRLSQLFKHHTYGAPIWHIQVQVIKQAWSGAVQALKTCHTVKKTARSHF